MNKITVIKGDAIVSIKVGAGFLQKLQKVMMNIVTDKSSEELETFKKSVELHEKENTEFSETWMEDLFTLSVLINEIESTLIKEGHTEEQDIEDLPATMPE
jgi:hypothetical protein